MTSKRLEQALEYLQEKHDCQYALAYGEPGYSDPEKGILFANWNPIPKRMLDWLESQGLQRLQNSHLLCPMWNGSSFARLRTASSISVSSATS